jgi:hypothetical protein
MMLRPENHRDEVWISRGALDIADHSIQNHDCCLAKVGDVVDVKDLFSPRAEKLQMLLLLVACIALLLAFWSRFPTDAVTRPMEPLTIETYFNTGWENDSAGGYVWVLNDKNKIIIANNEDVAKSGFLYLQIVGAPCGDRQEIKISSKSVLLERISINANEKNNLQLRIVLGSYERVPVDVDVVGKGCAPSATDGRLIKVQIRQPVFLPS